MNIDAVRAAFEAAEDIGASGAGAADPGPPPEAPDDPPPPPEAEGVTFPLNDYGNGLRLVHYYGENLLFVPRLGWHRWDGRRWAQDQDAIATRGDAQLVAAHIEAEALHIEATEDEREAIEAFGSVKAELRRLQDARAAKQLEDSDRERLALLSHTQEAAKAARAAMARRRGEHTRHARMSGNSPKITAMMKEAEKARAIDLQALDQHPMRVCVENGVLVFDRAVDDHAAAWGGPSDPVPVVRIEAHDRDLRITKMMAVSYDPAATCPTWERFIERIQPDPAVRGLLRRWWGYSLLGVISEQKLAFFYGHGRNGKSTMVDVLARIFGDLSTTLPIETLTGDKDRDGAAATPDMVRLPGARLVRASEPEAGQKMKEARIKSMTGGEPFPARRMHGEFFDVFPEFKLTISGNYKPEIRGGDDGIWRRVMLIPFDEQIPIEDVDPELGAKLWAERAGILNWCIAGCLEWMATGLAEPDSVRAATEDYRRDSDPARLFLETECDITGAAEDEILARDLGDAFNAWLLAAGGSSWTKNVTGRTLKARALTVKGADGQAFRYVKSSDAKFRGIRLKPEAESRVVIWRDQLQARK